MHEILKKLLVGYLKINRYCTGIMENKISAFIETIEKLNLK